MCTERVCRSCLQTTTKQTHNLYSTLETQLLGVITKLTCCALTDVLVLLLAHRQDLCQEIWMFSGTSRTKRCIPVHEISLPEEKRKSLLAFHTINGCDTTSQFAGIGKQSALKMFDASSKLIEHLGEHCPPEESVLTDAEAFVCQLSNHGTDGVDIDEGRAAAFHKVKKNLWIPFLRRRMLRIFIYCVRTSSA